MLSQELSPFYPQSLKESLIENTELLIEPKPDTPFIKLSYSEKLMMIKGGSDKENIHLFYAPIIKKFSRCLQETDRFTLNIFFTKLNASTIKILFGIFKTVRDSIASGTDISIYWGVESGDTHLLEIGKDFADIYDLEMQYLEISREGEGI